jgi:hypothetical protein
MTQKQADDSIGPHPSAGVLVEVSPDEDSGPSLIVTWESIRSHISTSCLDFLP